MALTTISYFDRERGRLIKTETPTGVLEYSYDDAGNKTKVKSTAGGGTNETTYGYDELGRLTTVRDSGDLLATYNYDALGNRESINRANGVSTTYRYDEQNRLRNVTHRKGTNVLSSFTYAVRNDGKRTGVTESLLNADEVNGVQRATERAVTYQFDLSGRFKSEVGTDGREIAYENAWQYDAAGNRTGTMAKRASVAGATTWTSISSTVATFNNNDWLTSQTTTTQTETATTNSTTQWTYDGNGSELTQQVNDNAPVVNTWSYEDKMLSRETQGGSAYEYSYDAAGNRVGVRTTTNGNTSTQNYLVDPNTSYAQVLQERDEDGVVQGRWVWGDGLAPLVMYRRAQNGSYALFFYLADGLENVRQLTDATGAVTDSYYYDAWGNALNGGSGNTPNPFRYTGQQLDNSGLYHLRARYMNTGTGRFLSHDPIIGNSQDPISLHRYLYCGDDPINYVDPSGELGEGGVGGQTSNIGVMSTLGQAVTRGVGSARANAMINLYRAMANSDKIVFYLEAASTVSALIAIGPELTGTALDAVADMTDSVSKRYSRNRLPIPANWSARGFALEAIGARHLGQAYLGGNVSTIDVFQDSNGARLSVSIRSHGLSDALPNLEQRYLNAFANDARQLQDVDLRGVQGTTHDGRRIDIRPPMRSDALVVMGAIPENHAPTLMQSPTFAQNLRAIAQRTRTIIVPMPVRGWRR